MIEFDIFTFIDIKTIERAIKRAVGIKRNVFEK